ncbi:hypothetical protein EGW08_013111 [Elysia chlorotica]|uniref:Uncharacterized protein n=1 Tax=Elysia chlorotica TaxID=188477 RepID=A0A3S0ZNM9_ELYCH|nr:hypothetical protein EGW08_013111 [Elysia chlorotica]
MGLTMPSTGTTLYLVGSLCLGDVALGHEGHHEDGNNQRQATILALAICVGILGAMLIAITLAYFCKRRRVCFRCETSGADQDSQTTKSSAMSVGIMKSLFFSNDRQTVSEFTTLEEAVEKVPSTKELQEVQAEPETVAVTQPTHQEVLVTDVVELTKI